MTNWQLEYLENLIFEMCSSIYDWTKADTRMVKDILTYYGYMDVNINFAPAMWPGNKRLNITIWTGDPEKLYDVIAYEY